MQVFDLLMNGSELVEKIQWNTQYFRQRMTEAGFALKVIITYLDFGLSVWTYLKGC